MPQKTFFLSVKRALRHGIITAATDRSSKRGISSKDDRKPKISMDKQGNSLFYIKFLIFFNFMCICFLKKKMLGSYLDKILHDTIGGFKARLPWAIAQALAQIHLVKKKN